MINKDNSTDETISIIESSSEFQIVETINSNELKNKNLITENNFINNSFSILKKMIYTIFPWLGYSIAITLYIISLQGCKGTQTECLQTVTSIKIKIMLYILATSAFFINFQIFIFMKDPNNNHIPFSLMITTFAFLCFFYDTGADFDTHGAYNRLILFLLILFWFIIYGMIRVIYYFLKHTPLITIVVLIIIIYFSNKLRISVIENSCEGWSSGFKGTVINNSDSSSGCKITPPKICYFSILDGSMDFTKILHENCNQMNTNKLSNNIQHIIDKSAKIIGYPRTENFKHFPDSQENIFQKNVMKNLINMEDKNIPKEIIDNIEVVTDYTQTPPKVIIDLKRNENLVKSRKVNYEMNKDKLKVKNVLHIFIDSISRANFSRKMPKLFKWLEDRYNLDNIENTKKTESFQFLKFHGLGTFTGINMVPAVFGVYNIYFNGIHQIRNYKKKGFITGQATGYCGREIFGHDPGAIVNLKWEDFDHELSSFFCDGNYTPYDDMYAILMGINSVRLRCLYNRTITSYNLEYAQQFFEKYKNEPKFFRMMFYEGHEGTQEVIKYSDAEIRDFLDKFEKQGILDDTAVVIQTDHGLGMAGVYSGFNLEDYEKERVLPSLYMLLPTNMKNFIKIRKNLKYNEQTIVTHFNVFNTLHSFINKDKSDEYYSNVDDYDLINHKIPRTRTCNAISSHEYWSIYDFICQCENQ